jgi:hypothetical protein
MSAETGVATPIDCGLLVIGPGAGSLGAAVPLLGTA